MPNRLLKESICESDEINKLSPFEECTFYRLIVNVDDYGRLDARPKILKAKLYPLKDTTEKQISNALQALSKAGLVWLYESDGRPFLQLVTWSIHQQIRAKKSKYPAPDEICKHLISNDIKCNQMISDDIKCSRNPIQSNPNPIRIQSEIERAENPYRPDFDTVKEYIAVKGFHFEAEEFMAYYDAVHWMQHGDPIKDWQAKCLTFENNHKKWSAEKKKQTINIPVPDYIAKQTEEREIDFSSIPGGADGRS